MGSSIRDWPNAVGLVRLGAHSPTPSSDVRTRSEVPSPRVVLVPHRELRKRFRTDRNDLEAARRSAVFVRNMRRTGQAERRRRPPKPQWPFALERDYASDLVAILAELRRRTDAGLAELPALIESARREREDSELLELEVLGLRIVIENPAGSVREWTDADGTKGQTLMRWSYGYLDGYEGADGEDVDVYVGPELAPLEVYVVHQRAKGPSDAAVWVDYDEDKVMLGWASADAAKAAYLAQYDDARFFGGMSVFTVDDFKRRLRANPGRKLTHADPRVRRLRVDVGEGRRVRVLLDRAREGLSSGAQQAERVAVAAAADVGKRQKAQLGKQSKAALGVDLTPLLADAKWSTMVDGFVAENVALITTLGAKTLDDLEKVITRGFADGLRAAELGAEIANRWGIAERHARLIARDQIGKLNGQITRARHKELGLARFRWLTMRDPKVRPRHKPMEGKVFTYEGEDKPPFFPGQEICCRCLEEPLFDDINAILDELEAQPVAPPVPPAIPPEDTEVFQLERARQAAASAAARAAAAEDLAAFNEHQAQEKAWAAKVQAAKEKQAKALAEHKAKMAAAQAAKELAAQKAAAEAAELAAKKAAAELAAKEAAELAAKQAAELAAKQAAELAAQQAAEEAAKQAAIAAQQAAELAAKKAAAKAASKAKKIAKLEASAAPFDPETSGSIGYIPAGKKKGKEKLLSKPGMVLVDADTIQGHGFVVKWSSADGKWVTMQGPHELGYKFDYNAQKWIHKDASASTAATLPAPSKVTLGPKPQPIKDFEWKESGGQWVLHKGDTPTSKLVPAYDAATAPTMSDTYSTGAAIAQKGLVPTGAGVMEGHGYKFVKDAGGTWHKMVQANAPYTAPPSSYSSYGYKPPAPPVTLGVPGDGEQLSQQAFTGYKQKFAKAINSDERSHVLRYSGSAYRDINTALRKGRPESEATSIKHIDSALAKAKLDRAILVHRGVSGQSMVNTFGSLKPGDRFSDKAYVSTSAFEGSAFGGEIKFRITVPPGFNAGAIPSNFENEKEFLLPRGTEFEVTGVTTSGGQTTLDVRVVSQPGVKL